MFNLATWHRKVFTSFHNAQLMSPTLLIILEQMLQSLRNNVIRMPTFNQICEKATKPESRRIHSIKPRVHLQVLITYWSTIKRPRLCMWQAHDHIRPYKPASWPLVSLSTDQWSAGQAASYMSIQTWMVVNSVASYTLTESCVTDVSAFCQCELAYLC